VSYTDPYKTSIGKGQFLLEPDNSEIQISTLPPFFSGPKGVDNVPGYATSKINSILTEIKIISTLFKSLDFQGK
jgi:hypothetical protein